MEILYDNSGFPLMMQSAKMFAVTVPERKNLYEQTDHLFEYRRRQFVAWGAANRAPEEMSRIIGQTGVLSTAIGFKTRTSLGQGVLCAGWEDAGPDAPDPLPALTADVNRWLEDYPFRQYMASALRDLFKFGNAFPVFYFNRDGSRIVRLVSVNARHCRLSSDKRYLLVYPRFDRSFPATGEAQLIPILDEEDPAFHLQCLRQAGKLRGQAVAFPRLKNYYSNNDYYAIPDWDAAYRSGWIDIAQRIPRFLRKAYDNAMSMMWHIQIPASFWETRFPDKEYNEQQRKEAVAEYMREVEDTLCGGENSSKTLFTTYQTGLTGAGEEKWEVTRLKNDMDNSERLSTSAAANSEILFSMMINPSVLGAGMPGGTYAGGAGSGSDIRESFLVSVITTWIEKRQVLDPVRLLFLFNTGHRPLLRYRETILTTLNTGQAVAQSES